jgi:hypothetical protein
MMAQPRYLSGAFLPQLNNGGFVLAQPPQQPQQQPMMLDPQRSGSAGRPLFSWDPAAVQAGAAAGLAATGFHAATAGAKAAAAVEAAQAMATSNGVDRLRQLSHVAEELADIPPGPAAAAAAQQQQQQQQVAHQAQQQQQQQVVHQAQEALQQQQFSVWAPVPWMQQQQPNLTGVALAGGNALALNAAMASRNVQ